MQFKRCLCAAALIAVASACSKEEPAPPKPSPAPAAQPAPAPETKPAPVVTKARLAAQTLFDFDRATIRPDGRAALDDVAASAGSITLEAIAVTGHADRIGSAAYNQALSLRRADAVKAYLASKGFDAARIQAEGKGKSQPVTGDKCSKMGRENRHNRKLIACLQPDRRVEIEVTGTRTQ